MIGELVQKIRKREACIAVVGLGHVGLPTAAVFADAGFDVVGVDIKQEVIEAISLGKTLIREHGLYELIKKVFRNGKLKTTTLVGEAVANGDVVIICVQTPLTENKTPNLSHLMRVCETIASKLLKGKLVIVESTVPPGTTRRLVAQILEKKSGLKCGIEFWLAHCPERMIPGNALKEYVEDARIIGGYGEEDTKIAVELFKRVTKGEILMTDCTSAEVAKLAENTFRDVNIAFANELAMICQKIGVDINEVLRLANTHPRVNIHKPGIGVGGTCIPKDPFLLLHPVGKNFRSRIIQSAREFNENMPNLTVELVVNALRESGKKVRNSKIVVLGVSYKGEVGAAINSPSEVIIRELWKLGARVIVYDPYSTESFGAEKARTLSKAMKEADCVLVATEHKMFQKLDLRKMKALMGKNPIIVDGRRLLDPVKAREQNFRYYGVGYGF